MEGLIKGIIDIALGGGGDGEDRHADEQPRSTWAEVVSSGHQGGEENKHQEVHSHPHHQHPPANWEPRKEEGGDEDGGEWKTVRHDSKHHSHPGISHKVPTVLWHEYKQSPSEQRYSSHVDHAVSIEITSGEIDDLSMACDRLWQLDLNRLVPGKDYGINLGEGKKVYQKGDMAERRLFTWVDDGVFKKPTFARFFSLLDNYNPHEGYKEVLTQEEMNEQVAFIEEICRTAPIKYLQGYLRTKGIVLGNDQEFKKMMMSIWFDFYGRGGGSKSSSAFEHVFVGEIKGRENEVSGFHNWIQFYFEEAKGRVDYQGYILPRRRDETPDSETQLITIQFEWNGVLKNVSSTLIGVSPEFEVALYTLCFYVGQQDNYVKLGPYSVNIKCYQIGRDRIGSVFPIAC